METLYQVANSQHLIVTTLFDPTQTKLRCLMEVRDRGHDVLAQGYGATMKEAAAACLADWLR